MLLFCQMDVTGRTGRDPAATALARSLLRYAFDWKPSPPRKALYASDPAGLNYLKESGLAPEPYAGQPLSPRQLLIAGPGSGPQLGPHAREVPAGLAAGGRLFALGLDPADAQAFLPFRVSMTREEHIAAFFAPFPEGSELAGIGPADLMNRDPRPVWLVTGGAAAIGNGVLARAGGVTFCQVRPWEWPSQGPMHRKRTRRRADVLVARLLANLGAAAPTSLLDRFARPPAPPEWRWQDGLYGDLPEEWDDPYRFFRW